MLSSFSAQKSFNNFMSFLSSSTSTTTTMIADSLPIPPSQILKYAGITIAIGLGVAVLGKGLAEMGKSSKNTKIEKLGNAIFGVAELALKAVLVPPVAMAIGIKYLIFEAVPKMTTKVSKIFYRTSSGTFRKILNAGQVAIDKAIVVPAKKINERVLTPVGNFLHHKIFSPLVEKAAEWFEMLKKFLVWSYWNLFLPSLAYALEVASWSIFMMYEGTMLAFQLSIGIVYGSYLLMIKTAEYIVKTIDKTIQFIDNKIVKPTLNFIKKIAKITKEKAVLPLWQKCIVAPSTKLKSILVDPCVNYSLEVWDRSKETLEKGFIYIINDIVIERMLFPLANLGNCSITYALEQVTVPAIAMLYAIIILTIKLCIFIVLCPIHLLVWSVNKIANVIEWIFRNIIKPFLTLFFKVLEKILVSIGKAAIWFYEKVLCTIGKGIKTGSIWFYKNALLPVFNVFAKIAKTVASVLKSIGTSIGNGATWFWRTVLSPVVSSVWNAIKAVSMSIYGVVSSVSISVFEVVKSVSVSLWNVLSSVGVSVANVVTSTIRSVVQIVSQVVTSIMNTTLVAIIQSIGRIFGAP